MCSVQISNILSQNQLYKTSLQKKTVSFRAKKEPSIKNTNTDYLFIDRFDEYFSNFKVLLDLTALHNMNLKNLRLINENFISGATLEKRSDIDLSCIRNIGIRKIIDLRTEAPKQYGKRCKKLGFDYYNIPFDDVYNLKNPKYFIREKNKPTKISDNFIKILKKLFNVINSGDVFLGCEYGIDRTNMALVLNYLLNKEPKKIEVSDNAPLLLFWPGEKGKEVFNRNVKATKKIFKMLSDSQKKELHLDSEYKTVLKDRIAKLFIRNKNGRIGRYL